MIGGGHREPSLCSVVDVVVDVLDKGVVAVGPHVEGTSHGLSRGLRYRLMTVQQLR